MALEYYPRIADALLEERLAHAGAVVIRGAKWCGKTRTAEQKAKSALYLQDPDSRASNLELAAAKPSVLLRGAKPRLIDEWQDAPESLKKLACKIDDSAGSMAFLAVITSSGYAYRREDGVYVIPISCLAP